MLAVTDVRVSFGDLVALRDVALSVPLGSTTVVMGPSGCGKSTLLRVIAGLQQPERGHVDWMGEPIDGVPPHERGFGLMFQDYALFPHRSVGANVGFGLRMAKWDEAAIRARVSEMLELVGLAGYTTRSIGNLSGGEQQRVALARALAPSPRVLMLDEPIGALDRDLRSALMREMRSIFRGHELSVIYVTHDQHEAFGHADHNAVMRSGEILRTGSPEHLWNHPGSAFVARFLGHENVIDRKAAHQLAVAGVIDAPNPMTITPEAVAVSPAPTGPGHVVESRFVTGRYRTSVRVAGVDLLAAASSAMPTGTRVGVTISPEGVTHLERDT